MSVTITLHLWWLWVYLAVGAVLWLPLEYLAWRQKTPRTTFWRDLRRVLPLRPWWSSLAIVAVWPVAVWEELR